MTRPALPAIQDARGPLFGHNARAQRGEHTRRIRRAVLAAPQGIASQVVQVVDFAIVIWHNVKQQTMRLYTAV